MLLLPGKYIAHNCPDNINWRIPEQFNYCLVISVVCIVCNLMYSIRIESSFHCNYVEWYIYCIVVYASMYVTCMHCDLYVRCVMHAERCM